MGNVDLIDNAAYDINVHHMKNTRERSYSTSLLLTSVYRVSVLSEEYNSPIPEDTHRIHHQPLIIREYLTSIIMGENAQKSKSEVRSMSFYEADSTLGRFLIDRCFRHNNKDRENLVEILHLCMHRRQSSR